MRRVCVFCGSSPGLRPAYGEAARAMGTELARRKVGLVYGGGNVGLMGELATAVMRAGGEAIGVIPEKLAAKELAHQGLSELRVVRSMHERKATMAELADAFLALPGGFGTFEELFEVITWTQLGLHRKACGVLDVDHFYLPMMQFVEHATRERFIRPEHAGILLGDSDPARLLDRLAAWQPTVREKWIERTEET